MKSKLTEQVASINMPLITSPSEPVCDAATNNSLEMETKCINFVLEHFQVRGLGLAHRREGPTMTQPFPLSGRFVTLGLLCH